MKTTAISIALLVALAAVPATASANHPAGFSMPGAAMWGLCNAWDNNENGRENGNAGNAAPFHWLQEQADEEDQTVEEYCSQFAKPGNGQGNPNNDRGSAGSNAGDNAGDNGNRGGPPI